MINLNRVNLDVLFARFLGSQDPEFGMGSMENWVIRISGEGVCSALVFFLANV